MLVNRFSLSCFNTELRDNEAFDHSGGGERLEW
jgi:hypothetical protein